MLCSGLKPTAGAFFLFMFTVALVAYTGTSMAMAISADQTVVAIANIFMTISFVFMMVTVPLMSALSFIQLGLEHLQSQCHIFFLFSQIFTGLLVNLPSIVSWLAWIKYLSIPRYGFSVSLEPRGIITYERVD